MNVVRHIGSVHKYHLMKQYNAATVIVKMEVTQTQ